MMETERLLLRPWQESDAEALYRWASDPEVGPAAGWSPHTSVENSRDIIRTVLSEEGTFAVLLKGGDGDPSRRHRRISHGDTGGERGAGARLLDRPTLLGAGTGCRRPWRRCCAGRFREMGAERVWCAYFPGNERSRRVEEKCGFRHVCDTPPSPWPDGTERPGVCQAITRQEWEVRHG